MWDVAAKTVTYTVNVGTDASSKGISPEGVKVTETFDPTQLTVVKAYAGDATTGDDITAQLVNPATMKALATDPASGSFAYAFTAESSAAPTVLTFVMAATDSALSAAATGAVDVQSKVSMSARRGAGRSFV